MPNDKIVEDREIITTGIKKQASADVVPLSAAQLEDAGVRVYNQPEVSVEQVKTTTAIQQENIDHLTKEGVGVTRIEKNQCISCMQLIKKK